MFGHIYSYFDVVCTFLHNILIHNVCFCVTIDFLVVINHCSYQDCINFIIDTITLYFLSDSNCSLVYNHNNKLLCVYNKKPKYVLFKKREFFFFFEHSNELRLNDYYSVNSK